MKAKIKSILDEIESQYQLDFDEIDVDAIKESLDLLEMIGLPGLEKSMYDKIIRDSALVIGFERKYPNQPVWYPFLFTN